MSPLTTTERKSLFRKLQSYWHPQPLSRPVIDPDLTKLSGIERSAEVLRYSASRAEAWLSPGGTLREWWRFNVRFAVVLAVPAFVVGPIVTALCFQLASWTALMLQSAINILLFLLTAIAIAAVISAIFFAGALLRR